MKEKIHIKELAKLAGVSIGTIDRVINNRSGVSKATRERVNKLIKETGYKRNVFASRLASREPVKIACLLPEPSAIRNYWQQHIDGILTLGNELKHMGLEIDFYHFPILDKTAFLSQCALISELEHKALISVPFFPSHLQTLKDTLTQRQGLTVLVDTWADLGDGCHNIYQEPFRAGRVAGRLLEDHFDNEVGHLLTVNISRGAEVHQNNFERARGIKEFFQECNKTVQVSDHNGQLDNVSSLEGVIEDFSQKMGRKAIFVTNSRAHLVAEILEKNPIKETIKVIGFDLNKENIRHMREGRISFLLHQKPYHQGQMAVRKIYERFVMGQGTNSPKTLVPIEIVVQDNLEDYIDLKDSLETIHQVSA